MECPKCKSVDVVVSLENTKSTTKKKSNAPGAKLVHGAARGTAAFLTLGVSNLFIPKHLEGGEKTTHKMEKYCVCQDCGYSWKIK